MEILTVNDLAKLLKISKHQVYEMTRKRTRTGAMRDDPLPCFRFNSNIRFVKEDIEAWVKRLSKTFKP